MNPIQARQWVTVWFLLQHTLFPVTKICNFVEISLIKLTSFRPPFYALLSLLGNKVPPIANTISIWVKANFEKMLAKKNSHLLIKLKMCHFLHWAFYSKFKLIGKRWFPWSLCVVSKNSTQGSWSPRAKVTVAQGEARRTRWRRDPGWVWVIFGELTFF